MLRRTLLAGAGLLLLAACMPTIAPVGLAATPPSLHDEALTSFDGTKLPLRAWLPPQQPAKAAMVALHGFNDYSNFIADAATQLAAQGVAVYAYDQRGFGSAPHRGLWGGNEAMARDLFSAVAVVRDRHPGQPLFVFGESMGGAVALFALAKPEAPRVDGVILSAPAVWGRASMPWYQAVAIWMAAHTIPYGKGSGRGLGVVASDNAEMLKALGRDPLVIKSTRVDAVYGLVTLMDAAMAASAAFDQRALILYGEKDQIIPEGAIKELLTRLPAASGDQRRYALYPAGYHMLLRDRQGAVVLRDVARWITDPAAPLPSAADVYAVETGACPAPSACPLAPPPGAGDGGGAGELR